MGLQLIPPRVQVIKLLFEVVQGEDFNALFAKKQICLLHMFVCVFKIITFGHDLYMQS